MKQDPIFFSPILYLNNVAKGIEFYKKAFDAIELQRWIHLVITGSFKKSSGKNQKLIF